MNLIQQLQTTPKWKEFSKWFVSQHYPCTSLKEDHVTGCHEWFVQLDIDFQKGVFEKFIESQGSQLEQNSDGNIMKYTIWTSKNGYEYQESLEELLIWYFNN